MCLDNPARETNQPQKKLFIFIVIKVTIRSYFLFHIIEFIHLFNFPISVPFCELRK